MRDEDIDVVITVDGDYYIHIPQLIAYIHQHRDAYTNVKRFFASYALQALADSIAAGVAELETIPDDISDL